MTAASLSPLSSLLEAGFAFFIASLWYPPLSNISEQLHGQRPDDNRYLSQTWLETQVNNNEQWQMSKQSAEAYERYVARYILGPWAPLLVDAAQLAPGERVLDVACGTGVVARAASC